MSKSKETVPDKSLPRIYSDSISKRRKALFINAITSIDINLRNVDLSDSFKPLEIDETLPVLKNTNKYIILEHLDDECEQDNMNNSTLDILETSTETSPAKSVIDETPNKESPTQKLKTPNETSTAKSGVPKLIRKSLLDSSFTENRMTDMELSPHNTSESHPSKLSKIRTALFPDDIVLPTRSFYPKVESKICKKSPLDNSSNVKTRKRENSFQYLCNRSGKSKKFGSINAGVRHNIKKPKRKSLKVEKLKAAIKLTENKNKEDSEAITNNQTAINHPTIKRSVKTSYKEQSQKNDTYIIEVNKDYNRKRPLSPDKTNEKKKFFKSSRNTVIVVDKNLKAQVINKDVVSKSTPTSKDLSNVSDFSTDNEFDNSLQIDNILNTLDDKENKDNSNILNKTNEKNTLNVGRDDINLMSPTSEMCDLTLSLAINSPKKARLDITKLLEDEDSETQIFNKFNSSDSNEKKYYSIFTTTNRMESNKENTVYNTNLIKKKWKALPADQMLLDAGQKKFGLTQCSECQFVYNMGDPNEELMHYNYHNGINALKFSGWKHENVVNHTQDYKIVKVSPGDSKLWWKKIHDVLIFVNRDLGFYEIQMNTEKSQVYLYITNKQIVGCLVAEPISTAYKMLESEGEIDMCSRESFPVKCGISRIWVKKECRRGKIATALVNCLRFTFAFGNTLQKKDLAFSSPTTDGKQFALRYCDSSNFYVYM